MKDIHTLSGSDVVHRDLRPQNIIVNIGTLEVKIVSLGMMQIAEKLKDGD